MFPNVTLNFVFSSTEQRNAVQRNCIALRTEMVIPVLAVVADTGRASPYECLHFQWRNAPSCTVKPEQIVLWGKAGDTQELASHVDSHSS